MTWQEKIISAHTRVTNAVSHYRKMKSDRYFVWQEENSNDLEAESVHAERAIRGTTDLFTKIENDPWALAFEQAMEETNGIAWFLNSIQYEEQTGFIHTEWVWEVLGDGVDTNQRAAAG